MSLAELKWKEDGTLGLFVNKKVEGEVRIASSIDGKQFIQIFEYLGVKFEIVKPVNEKMTKDEILKLKDTLADIYWNMKPLYLNENNQLDLNKKHYMTILEERCSH